MNLPLFDPGWMTEEHRMLRDSVTRYIADKWVPRAAEFRAAGKLGRCAGGAAEATRCAAQGTRRTHVVLQDVRARRTVRA